MTPPNEQQRVDVLAVIRAAKVLAKQYAPLTDDPSLRMAQMEVSLSADDAIAAVVMMIEALKDAECQLSCQPRINSYVIDKVRTALANVGAQK